MKNKSIFENFENLAYFSLSLLFLANSVFFVFLLRGKNVYLSIFNYRVAYLSYFFLTGILLICIIYTWHKLFNYKAFFKKLFLLFLPSEMVLLWGFQSLLQVSKSSFPVPHSMLLSIITTFYIVLVCLYLTFCRQGYKNVWQFFKNLFDFGDNSERKESGLKRIFYPTLVLVIILLNLGFGLYHLSKFAAVDEPLWTYDRIPKFWNNVADGEFYKTMVSDKPGITVAIISGSGLLKVNPFYYKNPNREGMETGSFLDVKDLNFAMRFPILLFNALMLAVLYLFLRGLLGKKTASISVALMGLSPILLGISTIINPDALIWVFMALSIISYLIYLRDWKNTYLFWAGIFLGLSLLTKYVANILYVFFFGLIILEYIINKSKYEKMSVSEYFKKTLADYLVLVALSLVTFIVLLPAAWVDISRLFEGTLFSKAFLQFWPIFAGIIFIFLADMYLLKSKAVSGITKYLFVYRDIIIKIFSAIFLAGILFTMFNTYAGMKYFNIESILASPKSSHAFSSLTGLTIANFYSLIYGIIPIAVFAIIFLLLKVISRKKISEKDSTSIYLIIFILLYYIASLASNVSATVRYQIAVYPIALILAAIGIFEFYNYSQGKIRWNFGIIFAFLAACSVYSLNFIKPFYFSYANDLLPNQYVLNLKDMGDGSFEAAQYLNSLTDAKNLSVWTDKRGVCTFFVGKCYSGINLDKDKVNLDYFVISAGRKSRTTKMTLNRFNGGNSQLIRLDKLYEEENYEYKLEIGGRPNNFVKIISSENLRDQL